MSIYHEKSPVDGRMHQQNIALLQAASSANTLAAFSAAYPGVFPPTDYYQFVAGGTEIPRTTIIVESEVSSLIVIMNGQEGFDKVPACLVGWALPQYVPPYVAYPYDYAAGRIASYLPAVPGGSNYGYVTIIGHSYGGAVAEHLLSRIPGIGADTDVKIYTYGAPKPYVSNTYGIHQARETRRVFLYNDPVPCLPLGPNDASNIWAYTGVPTARAWARWAQNVTGLISYPSNPELVPSSNPAFADTWGLIVSLAGWVSSSACFGSPNHSLTAYYAAMTRVPVAIDVTDVPSTGRTHSSQPATTVRLQENQAVAQAMIGEQIAANLQDSAIGIVSGTVLKQGTRYRGGMQNGVNAVFYGQDLVTFVRTRRQRKATVRRLNQAAGL